MAEDRRIVNVRITGLVQGVYYRGWTKSEAERLGLRGWVRNEYDRSVSVLLAGPRPAVEEMLRLMHRGPLDAKVEKLAIEEASPDHIPSGFSILH